MALSQAQYSANSTGRLSHFELIRSSPKEAETQEGPKSSDSLCSCIFCIWVRMTLALGAARGTNGSKQCSLEDQEQLHNQQLEKQQIAGKTATSHQLPHSLGVLWSMLTLLNASCRVDPGGVWLGDEEPAQSLWGCREVPLRISTFLLIHL